MEKEARSSDQPDEVTKMELKEKESKFDAKMESIAKLLRERDTSSDSSSSSRSSRPRIRRRRAYSPSTSRSPSSSSSSSSGQESCQSYESYYDRETGKKHRRRIFGFFRPPRKRSRSFSSRSSTSSRRSSSSSSSSSSRSSSSSSSKSSKSLDLFTTTRGSKKGPAILSSDVQSLLKIKRSPEKKNRNA